MEATRSSTETAADTPAKVSREAETVGTGELVESLKPDHGNEKEAVPSGQDLEKDAENGPTDEEHQYLTGVKLVVVLGSITLVYFLVMLDGSIMSTAIPQITTTFDSLLDVGWYGSAYTLASSASQPLSGKIYTYFNTKWSFLTFFFIFELGSALCGAAQSSVMLIVGRALAGLGSSGLMNGTLTILAAALVPSRQPMVMGINVSLGQLGIACGPLIGGAFTEYVSWRWCFYINLPVGAVIAILLVFLHVPENKPKPPVREVLSTAVHALDLLGFVIIAPTAIMFFLALQWGGQRYAWDSSVVIGLFVGSGVAFALFLWWEHHRGDDAMVPFAMIRERIIWSASATMFFFLGVLFCFDYYLPIFFQGVEDDTAFLSGVHMLPQIIGQVLFALVSGVMIQTFGFYLPWVLTGTTLATIGYGLLSTISPSIKISRRIGYQVLFGIGIGSATTTPFIAIQNLVTAAQIPLAMGILIFCQNLGGAIWLTVAQTIFSNSLRSTLSYEAPSVDPDVIISAGARSIRKVVSSSELPGVLRAYSKSVGHVFYLGIGLGAASFICSWGLGWKDIRKDKEKHKIEAPIKEGADTSAA